MPRDQRGEPRRENAMRRVLMAAVLPATLINAGAVQAELQDRGNGLIYDTVQDITWLQDANYAVTSGYAAANAGPDIGADGKMTWAAAVAWAEQLEYAGFTNWRLPVVVVPDPTCEKQGTILVSYGIGCTAGEMTRLFNVDGITSNTPGPFMNITSPTNGPWWTGTLVAGGSPESAYWNGFNFGTGNQDGFFTSFPFQVWAVHDGDIGASGEEPASLPLPGWTLAALAAALLGVRRWPSNYGT